jgi:CheY-like chemotaxis protein
VLEGDVEASLVGDQLVAMGASVARVRLKDAPRIAVDAAATGAPFTALLTDRLGVAAGAGRLIELLHNAPGIGRQQRTAVIIDPSERGDIASFRGEGFNFYLVRPVRPLSLLNQLFGDLDETQAKAIDAATSARRRSRTPRAEASGLSILLAEDNDINALLACTMLEKSGARVVRVRNGAEAIAKAGGALGQANGHGFDLIFMDIHMPDMDGIEAARRIRSLYPDDARPAQGRPPIVALTANAFADDRAAYLKAGLDDYLAKPFEKADLETLLARWKRPAVAKKPSGRGAA